MERKLYSFLFRMAVLALMIRSQETTQIASFLCLDDASNTDVFHMDFLLDRRTDIVTAVYAYNQQSFKDCSASSQDGGQTFRVRVTFFLSNASQSSPSSPCGMTVNSDGSYQLSMRSEASSGLVSHTDKIYVFKCDPSKGISPWTTTPGQQVGNVDLLNINSSRTISLQVVSAANIDTPVYVSNLGDLVRFKFTMTFTSAVENIDVLGVRLHNLICSPSDNFAPIRRILIDENGCAVNYTDSVLALSGPFTTSSTGSSPFIAVSPVLEIGRFSNSFELNFKVDIEYCTSTTDACFTDMCHARRKRSSESVEVSSVKTKINVYSSANSVGTNANKTVSDGTTNCFLTWMFGAVGGTVFFLLSIDSVVIVYLIKQLKIYKVRHVSKNARPCYPNVGRINTTTTFF